MINSLDYIKIYKKALSVKFCEALVGKAKLNESEWFPAQVTSGLDNYRSAKIFSGINKNYKTKRGEIFNFDQKLYIIVGNILALYQKNFPELNMTGDEGYQLLRYCVGDFYKKHIDNDSGSKPRTLSMVIMCNSDFKGGDLKFMGNHVIDLGVGDAIIFPSNFMFPHEVTPITEGLRYTISSFFN